MATKKTLDVVKTPEKVVDVSADQETVTVDVSTDRLVILDVALHRTREITVKAPTAWPERQNVK